VTLPSSPRPAPLADAPLGAPGADEEAHLSSAPSLPSFAEGDEDEGSSRSRRRSDATGARRRIDSDASQIAHPPLLPESKKGTWLWRVRGMVRTLRPQQWVKNLFVVAPIVFAKHLTDLAIIRAAAAAFAVFCLLAGAVYTLNDLVDADADRVHPVKRHRPIASGRVPVPVAKAMLAVLLFVSLGGALLGPPLFAAAAFAYFTLNLAYSFRLKKIAYVDVVCIAVFFVLRVLAGGFATYTPLSGFMIACTALLALFLGFGKRRHELASENASKQRASLSAYSPRALSLALVVTGAASVVTYVAYTLSPTTKAFFQSDWLWVTSIHPVFGVVRFLQLVAGRPKSESPTQEMLRDTPFVLNLVLWVVEVMFIVYHLRPA
jgi:4-hydroxybenzoate polyprenyltransferase